jgi:hypothetical protein
MNRVTAATIVLAFLHFTRPLADIPALVEVHHESAAFPQGLDAQLYRIPEAQAITEMFTQALASWNIAIKETGKKWGSYAAWARGSPLRSNPAYRRQVIQGLKIFSINSGSANMIKLFPLDPGIASGGARRTGASFSMNSESYALLAR